MSDFDTQMFKQLLPGYTASWKAKGYTVMYDEFREQLLILAPNGVQISKQHATIEGMTLASREAIDHQRGIN